MKKSAFFAVAAAVMVIGVSTPGLAHHSVSAQFDVEKNVSASGVLINVENINPHPYWYFEIKNASGVAEKWRFESVSPAILRRAGLKVKEDLKSGDVYNIEFAPARKADSKTGLLLNIEIGGKKIKMVPG